jgi:hypothetical protein
MNKEADDYFTFFRAGWRANNTLPDAWYAKQEYKKPAIYAFFWAPQMDAYSRFTTQSARNAYDFKELMFAINGHNLKAFDLKPFELNGAFTRSQAIAQLEQLKDMQNGDSCLIFYSGIGITNETATFPPPEETVAEPVFNNDELTGEALSSLRIKLRELIAGKEVHVFIILDFRIVLSLAVPIAPFINPPGVSLVVLESPAPVVRDVAQIETMHADNFFFVEIADLIRSTGAKMRYTNLIDRLQLRYLTTGVTGKPKCLAFPETALQTYIFSGVFSGKSDYRVYYSEERKEWEVNAGSLNGILPSLSFMHTLFLLDDDRQVSVRTTYDSYSVLLNFEEPDTENTFEAKLVQTALCKMKVSFHPALSPEMKARFENEVTKHDIYFIDLVENARKASFLIKNRDHEYYLVRNGEYMGFSDDRPVFFFQEYAYEFIKQLEYIAQWQALLELDNSRTRIDPNELDIVFEVLEGSNANESNFDRLPAIKHINPENLTVRYRNNRRPLLRCKVVNKLSSQGSNYYINFLYLDSRFGIQRLSGLDENLLTPRHDVWATMISNGKMYKTIPLQIADFYLDNKINEIQDFLLVLVSTEPLGVAPLTQPFLQPSRELSRSMSIEEAKHSFVLPAGDWFVRRVPIRIAYDDRSFEQTVKDMVASRPINIPGDLHKNRWGKKAINNGFILSAEVTERGYGLFTVQLQVRHQAMLLGEGEVAFLLHDSFGNPIMFENFVKGAAKIELTAYEDFTAAAIIYDGTELELDLSEIPGLPEKFYALQPRDTFKQQVEPLVQKTTISDFETTVTEVIKTRTISVPNDLQKNRWGGQSANNGKTLTAEVIRKNGSHEVTLTIQSSTTTPLNGEVAFFLHDSFAKEIVYTKAVEGKATYVLNSYEAFTVGAYTEDGTMLELDLNQATGFPEEFYYK